jgi:ferritin-like metal-binding protein YciE
MEIKVINDLRKVIENLWNEIECPIKRINSIFPTIHSKKARMVNSNALNGIMVKFPKPLNTEEKIKTLKKIVDKLPY